MRKDKKVPTKKELLAAGFKPFTKKQLKDWTKMEKKINKELKPILEKNKRWREESSGKVHFRI